MRNLIKKLIPYLFVILVLVGLFSLTEKEASAQETRGVCIITSGLSSTQQQNKTEAECNALKTTNNSVSWIRSAQNVSGTATPKEAEEAAEAAKNSSGSALYDSLSTCPPVSGCVGMILYWLFYAIPSFLLGITANFFNVIISLTIQSDLYSRATFVGNAWTVVRDLSNIFFILVLLYVAIQTILGLSHETKKVIVRVIIMALLINFSMFFSKVVIDSSNILALIFYNKINVTLVRDGKIQDTNYIPVLRGGTDKDVSGRMMGYFDPTKILTNDFFDKFRRTEYTFSVTGAAAAAAGGALVGSWIPVVGTLVGGAVGIVGYTLSGFSNSVPIAISIGFILTAGSIIIFAAYAFLVAGMSFLARMIELWILIIFSPFAFMSFSLPFLENMKYIGWKSWIDRIIKLSFMAPIFMFFMYLIFMIIQSNIFVSFMGRTDLEKQTWMETLLFMVIPALVILILLMKATKYAKEASGEVGSMVIGGAKMLAGLAVGGTALGSAQILRGSVGAFMKGASTGDTAAQRFARGESRGRVDRFIGSKLSGTKLDQLQQWTGKKLNADQKHIEEAKHARHELDTAAEAISPGKKWEELNGEQRYQARRKIAREEAVRQNSGTTGLALGTRKWEALTTAEQTAIYAQIGADARGNVTAGGALDTTKVGGGTTKADDFIREARRKQGLVSNITQSSVTGSYDIRNLANVIAKEQSTGFAKIAMGLTGAAAMGMRGGFKQLGVNYGEGQGKFFKDLANTISDSLKSVKISVDTSHVGEVKKEDGHGGGGGHH